MNHSSPQELYFQQLLERTQHAMRRSSHVHSYMLRIGEVRIRLTFADENTAAALMQTLWHIAMPDESGSWKKSWEDDDEHLNPTPDEGAEYEFLIWDALISGVSLTPAPYEMKVMHYQGEILAMSNERIRMSYAVGAGVLQMMDHRRKLGIIAISDHTLLDLTVLAAPFRLLFVWVLNAEAYPVVHAAAVGDAHGAVLLTGQSGSGKSSTALECLSAGLDFLGDDLCAISVGPCTPQVHSLYGTAKCHLHDCNRYPALSETLMTETHSNERKGVFQLLPKFQNQVVVQREIRAVLIPNHRSGKFGLTPGSAGMAIHGLASEATGQTDPSRRMVFQVLSALMKQVPVWTFHLGSDRALIPEVIDALLTGREATYLLPS